ESPIPFVPPESIGIEYLVRILSGPAVAHEEIKVAIVLEVEPDRGDRRHRVIDTGLGCDVRKVQVTVVSPEVIGVLSPPRSVAVEVAIVVIVPPRRCARHDSGLDEPV